MATIFNNHNFVCFNQCQVTFDIYFYYTVYDTRHTQLISQKLRSSGFTLKTSLNRFQTSLARARHIHKIQHGCWRSKTWKEPIEASFWVVTGVFRADVAETSPAKLCRRHHSIFGSHFTKIYFRRVTVTVWKVASCRCVFVLLASRCGNRHSNTLLMYDYFYYN